jgi:hypothetical protein
MAVTPPVSTQTIRAGLITGDECRQGSSKVSYVPPPQALRSIVNAIDSYLLQAILATIFCCVPFGIVAIVYAARVKTKIEEGDTQSAMDASRKARKWCRASLFTSLRSAASTACERDGRLHARGDR